ncbi:MAG TPA: Dabb family protein [Pyrinomonadaceae bacterium]|jgi:hypothetical protein|nr:Dabb family protein [Pyrinomonadaceae bacterium]
MLTHIVCWKYKPEITEESREAHREKLRALVGVIPEIITFACGADMVHLPRSYDTGLASTFADNAALDSYTAHPEHQAVAALGRELSENIISVDFVTED